MNTNSVLDRCRPTLLKLRHGHDSYSYVDDRHVREQLFEPGVQNDALLDVPARSFHEHAVDVGSIPRCRPIGQSDSKLTNLTVKFTTTFC